MKAVFQNGYGGPSVLQIVEREKPSMSENEIMVRNYASTVSAADQAFRSGSPFIARLFAGVRRPKNPFVGEIFAGIVERVGTSVSDYSVGERVWGLIFGASEQKQGALGEYVSVGTHGALGKLLDEMSFEEAAGLLDGGLTAISFLQDHFKMIEGQKILVNGASGSIGSIAVQLAKNAGLHVTAVSSKKNHELLKLLGAHDVIDYNAVDFAENLNAYDLVFDAIGKRGFADVQACLKSNGAYLTTVPSWAILATMFRTRRKTGKWGRLATTGLRPAADKAKDMRSMAQMFKLGVLKPVLGTTFALTDIVKAHELLETERKVGAAVINI